MSTNKLWLRVIGEQRLLEELETSFSALFAQELSWKRTTRRTEQPNEAGGLSLVLIERDQWTGAHPVETALGQAITLLRQMAPALASLDRSHARPELYLSSIRDEEQGGVSIPAELVGAASAGNLELSLSILVMWPESDATAGHS